ncbi:serine hydrolase domain-containing protein [Pseudalkalibacillus berkeleyi]|uniref:Beta-lactamase family protein n=1 Tax=Pseudalkalibacillus berkeleyi TaxID=1069813 RepID=A0ABS9H0W9_9BACL|nr:serine hydrolase [Pseudalkalibacillus berkeleyi]MCF6137480.1 beta-lactamase family protein [Pseudalkalibacillus berkeleyi]
MTNSDLSQIESVMKEENFSGAVLVKKGMEQLYQDEMGYSNRSDLIPIKPDTKFGIASGCKLFTSISICQLVENGALSFETKLKDCLDIDLPHFHKDITVHHLLTHTSGIPDYFDEAVMDNYEDLWKQQPMYLIRKTKDFLPMFQQKEMVFTPGEKFHYNNAAFILLGLIVESKADMSFTDYVEKNIFQQLHMNDSGYFLTDRLPQNTAIGYIDEKDGSYRSNIFSVPIQGGPDGGAFVTTEDMAKIWEGLVSFKLMSQDFTKLLLTPHVEVREDLSYGYGVWLNMKKGQIYKYHLMGYDPGVSFHSAYYLDQGITLVIPSNHSNGPFKIMKEIEKVFNL